MQALEQSGEQVILHFTRGGPVEHATTEAVFAAVGWPANLQNLDLDSAAVTSNPRAIPVDDHLQTNVKHIFARYDDLVRPVADGHPDGFCKLIADRHSHLILGAHVLGEYSAETVQVVATAMRAGMNIEQWPARPAECPADQPGAVAPALIPHTGCAPPRPGSRMIAMAASTKTSRTR